MLRSSVTDIDDHLGYGVCPPLAYAGALGGAICIFAQSRIGPPLLAGALILSLLVNIRNTWDLTVFFAQRRSESQPDK